MPCPHFEPQRVTPRPTHANARLPLIDEYEGVCHASGEPAEVSSAVRFQFCNHGYSRGACGRTPNPEGPSCLRFEVLSRDGSSLEVLCVEEQEYAPLRWTKVRFSLPDERVQPEPADTCVRAQIRAFGLSFARHFADALQDSRRSSNTHDG
ncbi:MAG: hypothetical protein JO270_20275 [Acidobacteriaceae bacterium]|nr:hypothetical protein [Acidobacteriaceae bacterium]MBV8572148.1 hypothetical protein [Acidobacteriaceae bacterium]